MRTVGIEEELLIVDPVSGMPLPRAARILDIVGETPDGPVLKAEFKQEQIEANTRPCRTAAELFADIRSGRAMADAGARAVGSRIAAVATPPLFAATPTSGNPRYTAMSGRFGLTSHEQITCGFHIHVSITSPEEGVGILDRLRVWLPSLLALSANSPFWKGSDTGYASYRSQIWNRWPSAGPVDVFGSPAGYNAAVSDLLASGVLLDEDMIYFDARVSRTYPTVEIRIADVCLYAEDAVTLAILARALVETSAREWLRGMSPPAASVPQLRMANWLASRSGINGELLHPRSHRPRPAKEVIDALAEHLGSSLRASGENASAAAGLERVFQRGSGERLQRLAYAQSPQLAGVVGAAISQTHHDDDTVPARG